MLADPVIDSPAQIVFDGNGRMFVLEVRGYFQTAEGLDLIPPEGRISVHEDRNADGVYERHSVFVDKLVFPRFVTPFGDGSILTMETNADEVWKYTDTNGDGVADKRSCSRRIRGAGSMESQQAGLVLGDGKWFTALSTLPSALDTQGLLREPPDRTGPSGG